MQVTVTVNGQAYTRDIEPRMLLVHFLRDELGLTAVRAPRFAAAAAEDAVRGRPADDATVEEAGRLAAQECNPVADQRGPADYKRHLAGELTRRALRRAIARSRGQETRGQES